MWRIIHDDGKDVLEVRDDGRWVAIRMVHDVAADSNEYKVSALYLSNDEAEALVNWLADRFAGRTSQKGG